MIIVQKRYLPFVENWSEAGEYPRKEHECNHLGCSMYKPINGIMGLCTRRNIRVIKTQMRCECYSSRYTYCTTGNNNLVSIGDSV